MEIFCVKCKNRLPEEPVGENGVCPHCRHFYGYNGKYLELLKDENYYWGEISKSDIQQLLDSCRKGNYRKACFLFFKDHPRQSLFYYIVNEPWRTAFLNFIYQKKTAGRCLDVGSGYGAIPSAFSKKFEFVYSLELVKERVEFQVLRKEQDRINNWQIIRGDIHELPFPDNYFDFVSVNGVLEWAAVANFTDTPKNVQINFLKEIKRVLKPSGVCYIGIENRIGMQYFRGALDHSGLKYTSLMPRAIADIVCRFFIKKDIFFYGLGDKKAVGLKYYRTNTYTKLGYKNLLKAAGIKKVRIFDGGPSYDYADSGIDDSYAKYTPSARDIIKVFHKLPQFKYAYNKFLGIFFSWVSPTFLIFFGKDAADFRSDLEKQISRLYQDDGPLYIRNGFNGLSAYSFVKKVFYRITDGSDIKVNKRIMGKIPDKIEPDLFERVLKIIKRDYYSLPYADPQKFNNVMNKISEIAVRYDINPVLLQKYLIYMRKYQNRPFFSSTHGDLWRGNIIITADDKINIIDEEKDKFGLMPVDITRFLMSITGYDKEPDNELFMAKIEKIFPDFISKKIIKDFYLISLFYELLRYDYLEGNPGKALFLFVERIENKLNQLAE